MYQGAVGKVTLTLGRFLGEDMAFVSVIPLYFSGAGERESLLGTGVGFHFWHCRSIWGYSGLLLRLRCNHHQHLFSFQHRKLLHLAIIGKILSKF